MARELTTHEEAAVLLTSENLKERGILNKEVDPVHEMLNNPHSSQAQVLAVNVAVSQIEDRLNEQLSQLQHMQEAMRQGLRSAGQERSTEPQNNVVEMHEVKLETPAPSTVQKPQYDELSQREKELDKEIEQTQSEIAEMQKELDAEKARVESIHQASDQKIQTQAGQRANNVAEQVQQDLASTGQQSSEELHSRLTDFMKKNAEHRDPTQVLAESRVRLELEQKGQEFDPTNKEHQTLVKEERETLDQSSVQAKALNIAAIDLAASLQNGPNAMSSAHKQQEQENEESPDKTKDDDERNEMELHEEKITPNALLEAASKLKSTTVQEAHQQRQIFQQEDMKEIKEEQKEKMEDVKDNMAKLNRRQEGLEDKLNNLKDQSQDLQNDLREKRKDEQEQRQEQKDDKEEEQQSSIKPKGPGSR